MQRTGLQIGHSVHSKVYLNISLKVLAQTTRIGSPDGKHHGPRTHIHSQYIVYP